MSNTAVKLDLESTEYMEYQSSSLPEGFCYLKNIAPNILVELRYATTDNFTGKVVDGYHNPDAAICTIEVAQALKAANDEFNAVGLGIKVFDMYRPLKACKFFKSWSEGDEEDLKAKQKYYPDIDKKDLFDAGYISERSGHCRGSTVDLTLVSLETHMELDMGTKFDFFSERAHTKSPNITEAQAMNRSILVDIMNKYGFANYSKEWWHYTLRDEPFQPEHIESYFDFDVM